MELPKITLPKIEPQHTTPLSSPSSVPYTPLIDDDFGIFDGITGCRSFQISNAKDLEEAKAILKSRWCKEDKVLSALNGYKQDILEVENWIYDKKMNVLSSDNILLFEDCWKNGCQYSLVKKWGFLEDFIKEHYARILLDKWFPILSDEVKKE